MNNVLGSQLARKRRMMGLSQRKAASLVEKIYGLRLSHSYLSMIERGMVDSVSESLEKALFELFKLDRPLDTPDSESNIPNSGSHPCPSNGFRRIPLYDGNDQISFLDITHFLPADYAVKSTYNNPYLGIFVGDVLLCRHTPPTDGDMVAVKENGNRFSFKFYSSNDGIACAGTVLLVLKKSVNLYFHRSFMENAAAGLDEDLLVKSLAVKTGLKESDLRRSLAVLMSFRDRKRAGSRR